MLSRLFATLAVASLLTGCTFLGQGESTDAPLPDGPYFWLDVVNKLPGEATVDVRVGDAEARQVVVPGGQTASAAVPVPAEGPNDARITYAWSGGGEGASGSNVARFDSSACDGLVHVAFTLTTSAEGTFSEWTTSCDAR